jgi:hypothetical protein
MSRIACYFQYYYKILTKGNKLISLLIKFSTKLNITPSAVVPVPKYSVCLSAIFLTFDSDSISCRVPSFRFQVSPGQ